MYIQKNYYPDTNSFNVLASRLELCDILNQMEPELFGQCSFGPAEDESDLFIITIMNLTSEQGLAVMEAISC